MFSATAKFIKMIKSSRPRVRKKRKTTSKAFYGSIKILLNVPVKDGFKKFRKSPVIQNNRTVVRWAEKLSHFMVK